MTTHRDQNLYCGLCTDKAENAKGKIEQRSFSGFVTIAFFYLQCMDSCGAFSLDDITAILVFLYKTEF